MRVLHWYPNILAGGGIASAVIGLASAQQDLGADILIAAAGPATGGLGAAEIPDDVETVEWNARLRARVGNYIFRSLPRAQASALRAFRPDIVHVHFEFSLENLRVPRLFDCPIVLSPQGAFDPLVFSTSILRNKTLYAKLARQLLYRRVSRWHATSPREAEHIRRLVHRASIYTLPQSTDEGFLAAIASVAVKSPARNSSFRLVYVGRLDIFTKGLDILLQAVAGARRARPAHDLRLVLVGCGTADQRRTLEQQAYDLGIRPALEFRGLLDRKHIAGELQTADAYVQLSRHDSFSVSVAEALLAGKPSILSSAIGVTSFAEVAHLPSVQVVEPEASEAVDALVKLMDEPAAYLAAATKLVADSRRFFSWARIAEEHLQVYEALANRVPTARVTVGG